MLDCASILVPLSGHVVYVDLGQEAGLKACRQETQWVSNLDKCVDFRRFWMFHDMFHDTHIVIGVGERVCGSAVVGYDDQTAVWYLSLGQPTIHEYNYSGRSPSYRYCVLVRTGDGDRAPKE
jgi:hypothetical protein